MNEPARVPVPPALAGILFSCLSDVDAWNARVRTGTAESPQPGSALAGDDRWSSELTVSTAALSSLQVAVDNVDALRTVILDESEPDDPVLRTRPWACYPLMRAALETGAQAVWLLAPPARATRVARRLSQALTDAGNEDRARANLGQTDVERLPNRRAQIEAVLASRPELDAALATSRTSPTQVLKGAQPYIATQHLLGLWNALSGASHGDWWAGLSLSTPTATGAPRLDGRVEVSLASTPERVILLYAVVCDVVRTGWELWDERSGIHV